MVPSGAADIAAHCLHPLFDDRRPAGSCRLRRDELTEIWRRRYMHLYEDDTQLR